MRMYQYKTKSQAKKKQMLLKKEYGYTPTILKVKNPKTKTIKYVVVKPSGLTKIK